MILTGEEGILTPIQFSLLWAAYGPLKGRFGSACCNADAHRSANDDEGRGSGDASGPPWRASLPKRRQTEEDRKAEGKSMKEKGSSTTTSPVFMASFVAFSGILSLFFNSHFC